MTRITDPRERRRRHRAPEADHLAAAVRLEASLQDMRARDTAAGAPDRPDDEPPTGLIDLNAIRAMLGQPTTGEVDPAAAAWLAGGADPAAARVVDRVDRLDGTVPAAEASFGDLYDQHPELIVAAALELTADELADVEEPAPVEAPVVLSLREHFEQEVAKRVTALEQPATVEYTCEVLGNAFHTSPCGPAQHPAPILEVPPPPPVFSSEHPRLTWRSRHDPRSLAYGVRRQFDGAAPLTDHLWWPGTVGDQGAEGACVGWGIVDALNARAAGDVDLTADDAAGLYARAQQIDDIPGVNYTGTSVLAGLQAARERGLIESYAWCFGTRDVAQAVLQRGPVVVGVPWLSGMYDTGPGGLVQLTGEDTGAGHCLAIVGLLLRGPQGQPGPYFVWQNSWGADYGDGGLGYIHHRDLARLLHVVGEAAVPQ